jgi:hypothetical protein
VVEAIEVLFDIHLVFEFDKDGKGGERRIDIQTGSGMEQADVADAVESVLERCEG